MEKELSKQKKNLLLFISNKDTNDIIKITKSLEDLSVLIDGVTETVKHEIKKARRLISSCPVSIFGCFINATSNFFSSETYKRKRS